MLIDLSSLLPAVILLVVMLLPIFVAVALLTWIKRSEARDERRSPIKEKLLHQPGAQARIKADDLADEMMQRMVQLIVIGPAALLAILLTRVNWSRFQWHWLDWVVIAGALAWTGWMTYGLVRFRRERKQWLNGMRGEMATAQELDRLRVKGCEVFHDLPGDKGNIDHVIVAPNAVFAVETKWRSKVGEGKKSAGVQFNGKALLFSNGYPDSEPVDQAQACAKDLARFLKGKTGEPVKVVPVVALPGWYVTNKANPIANEAVAINPKLAYQLLERPGTPIPQAQRNRIIAALTERYPELES